MTAAQFNLIYWDPIGTTMAASPQFYQLWASKQVTRFCATGRMMLAIKMWDNDHCTCCKAANETTTHILICSDPDMMEMECFAAVLADLKLWHTEHETQPDLQTFLLRYTAAQDTVTFAQLPDLPQGMIKLLAADQDTIGWQNCLEGKLPYSLYQFQELCLDTLNTRRTITGWASGCDVVHARKADGLKTAESNTLQEEIRIELALGYSLLSIRFKGGPWAITLNLTQSLNLTK
eukprot:scaffold152065_cov75-Attheya_sp.AAC.1